MRNINEAVVARFLAVMKTQTHLKKEIRQAAVETVPNGLCCPRLANLSLGRLAALGVQDVLVLPVGYVPPNQFFPQSVTGSSIRDTDVAV